MRPYWVTVALKRTEGPRLRLLTLQPHPLGGGQAEASTPEAAVDQELASGPRSQVVPREAREVSDADLVQQTRAGKIDAFEQLYRRYAKYAFALAVRIQGSTRDVEDVVHDAFLRVHARLDDLKSDDAFRPWLGSVVVSLVRTQLRRRRFLGAIGFGDEEAFDLDALAADAASPEIKAQLGQVYRVLLTLPVDYRISWTLRYVQGHKLEDVAALSGCSLATAKRRILWAQARILESEHG